MTASACAVSPAASVPRLWLETASSTLPDIARDIVGRICDEVPEYGIDSTGVVETDTRHAVREALTMFMRSVAWGVAPDQQGADVFRRLGRREARAGRSHDTLQSAYRVASQSVMQSLLRWEREHDAPREAMAALSTAVFDFVDELAHFSAEGYAEALSSRADDEAARGELLGLLVHRDGFARRQVTEAAARVGWSLPASLAIAEVVGDTDRTLLAACPQLFGTAAVAGRVGERCLVAIPGPVAADDLRHRLAPHLADLPDVLVVVGPVVPLVEAGSSARLVQRLRVRHDVRSRAAGAVALCDDSLVDLLLDCGRDSARTLATSRLAPLAALSPGKRVKYGRLLSAWLEFGTLNADAPGVLDKHRQTLRYQVGQLEKMFGDALHDRDSRVEIMLALRAALPLWERQAAPGSQP